MQNTIIYDQPMNELIRACLRLEQLFQQVDHQLIDMTVLGSRNIITTIINLLCILDRPDLKAKLAKELSVHQANLARYSELPEIDKEKLNHLTSELNKHSRSLIDSNGKIGHRLRDYELLNTLRLHIASPGGGCSFDLPLYHNWLQQPTTSRQQCINDWLGDFHQIREVVHLILDLIRKNSKVEQKTAINGFYQELLDPKVSLSMVRIGIDPSIKAYPETSISRHFLGVRFYNPDIIKRPAQFSGNLPFWIAFCNS